MAKKKKSPKYVTIFVTGVVAPLVCRMPVAARCKY